MNKVNYLLEKVTAELKVIPGIVGIVLGGSRARGNHQSTSDIDIGIYYDESLGFSVDHVRKVAAKLDDQHREDVITNLGDWGPWVNGGGWLVIDGYHVDFIFRDIHRVSQVIEECLEGNVLTHYHAGHPHGYLNVMYMGEVAICKILFEKDKSISLLKAKATPYPKALKEAMIQYFLFETNFSMMFVQEQVEKDDLSYLLGHCYRTIACLNQVLFAVNEEYCINEKKAVHLIEGFQKKPTNYKQTIDRILSLISTDVEQTKEGVSLLQKLISETTVLVREEQ